MQFGNKYCYENRVKDFKVIAMKAIEYILCPVQFNLLVLILFLTFSRTQYMIVCLPTP